MPEPLTCVSDLRALARRRVPRALFEYADRGAFDELTLLENRSAIDALHLKQRIMIDVEERSLSTTLAGQQSSLPIAIAPTGLAGLQCGGGEILGARAAARAGIPFCLSTMSICSIEQVHKAVPEPFWFQLYVMRDRAFTRELIRRARDAQCSALMLTADLTVQGKRHREIKNGLAVPPRLTLRNAVDIARRPRWAWGVLRAPSRSFGNLDGRIAEAGSLTSLAQWIGKQFDATLCWQDLEWIRDLWPGKLILKGVMCRDIADEVAGRVEILFDGGVTSGQAVLKALALGARGCLIGKAFLYGLGALGEEGVSLAVEFIRRELDVSMALTGQRDVQSVPRSIIVGAP